MRRVLIGGLVIGAAHTATASSPDDPCREAARRTPPTTIIARPRAIAPAGVACPASASTAASGCVVGVIRHGATCMPAGGVEVFVGNVTTTSDATGAYRACKLPAGALVLVAPQAGVTREVRAGDVVDLDSTYLGELGIRLDATSIVTFEVERVVAGAPIGSPVDVFVQTSPSPPAPIEIKTVRPSYELGRSLELHLARDPATNVLVAETCWIRPAPAPAPAPSSRRSSCGHCGAVDPSVFVVFALLGLLRGRRC